MTRLLAATLAVLLCAYLLGGCSVGCRLTDCKLTTTDGVTITGGVEIGSNTVTVYRPQGNLRIEHKQVLRIERLPEAERRTP
jgi:hypothetical protein